jgi:hypothetical protein
LSALLATLLAALSGLLLLLTWLLLATALLATLTALLTTLLAALTALLAALVWILISHDLISPAGKFPQRTTFHPAGTFLSEGDSINAFDGGAPRRRD